MPQGQRGAGISWPQRGEVSVDAASTTTELDGSGVVVAPRWLTQLSAGHVLVGDSGETVPRDQFESTNAPSSSCKEPQLCQRSTPQLR